MPIRIIRRASPTEAADGKVKPDAVKSAPAYDKPLATSPVKLCRYCFHAYVNGGCNFDAQKKCVNRASGQSVRVVATVSKDHEPWRYS